MSSVKQRATIFVSIIVALVTLLWEIPWPTKLISSSESVIRKDAPGRREWKQWFDPLRNNTWDASWSNSSNNTNLTKAEIQSSKKDDPYLIMYYHVMKTGGSTLYKLFRALNLQNGFKPYMNVTGLNSRCCGIEDPHYFDSLLEWRRRTDADIIPPLSSDRKLFMASFREPVERTISHYFQVKPCPDGRGGGLRCKGVARRGIGPFLRLCKYGSNWQTQYVDGNHSKIRNLDFVIRSDRMEESLVLLSIYKRIPILGLVSPNEKVRTTTNFITSNSNAGKESLTCTNQWMKKLIPRETLQALPNCTNSCAGIIGRYAFNDEELEDIMNFNKKDLQLWNDYVVPTYNKIKAWILKHYNVNEADLNEIVDMFRRANNGLGTVQKN